MSAIGTLKDHLGDLLVEDVPLLKTPKTLQLLVLRQTHDYTVFRTEETRDLNVVSLPTSLNDAAATLRVAMLASKQKAAESRFYASLWKQLAIDLAVEIGEGSKDCYLMTHLCRQCPRCVLFGAVRPEQQRSSAERWNVKHRIEYSTAYSLQPYQDIAELITFNAVNEVTQSTGTALQATEVISPVVDFPSVVSLNSTTAEEVILYVKTLLACHSYGAETRTRGDMTNHIVGIIAGYEEVVSSLEYVLEMSKAASNTQSTDWFVETERMLTAYTAHTAFPSKVRILGGGALQGWLEEVRQYQFDKESLGRMAERCRSFYHGAEKAAGGGADQPQRAGRSRRGRAPRTQS
jgi:CRISPR type I-D-associated protein Csc2